MTHSRFKWHLSSAHTAAVDVNFLRFWRRQQTGETPPLEQFPTSDELSGCHIEEEQKGDLAALSTLPPLFLGSHGISMFSLLFVSNQNWFLLSLSFRTCFWQNSFLLQHCRRAKVRSKVAQCKASKSHEWFFWEYVPVNSHVLESLFHVGYVFCWKPHLCVVFNAHRSIYQPITIVGVVILAVVRLRMSFKGVSKWCGQMQSYEVRVACY